MKNNGWFAFFVCLFLFSSYVFAQIPGQPTTPPYSLPIIGPGYGMCNISGVPAPPVGCAPTIVDVPLATSGGHLFIGTNPLLPGLIQGAKGWYRLPLVGPGNDWVKLGTWDPSNGQTVNPDGATLQVTTVNSVNYYAAAGNIESQTYTIFVPSNGSVANGFVGWSEYYSANTATTRSGVFKTVSRSGGTYFLYDIYFLEESNYLNEGYYKIETAAPATWTNIATSTSGSGYGDPALATSTASTISGTTFTAGGTITGSYQTGQVLSGTGITGSPTITGYGSGSGFAGTYTITNPNSVSVSSESITGTLPAANYQVALYLGNIVSATTVASSTVSSNFVANNRLTIYFNGVTYYIPASTTAW
jgi:hypothetical protein